MTQHSSAKVSRQGQADEVGTLKASYCTANPLLTGGRFLLVVPVFLLLAVLVGQSIFSWWGHSFPTFAALQLLFTVFFLWVACLLGRTGLGLLLAERVVVSVHSRGLLFRQGRLWGPQTVTVIRWDQISYVSAQLRAPPLYTLHFTNGKRLLLSPSLNHLEALVATIEEEVARSNAAP